MAETYAGLSTTVWAIVGGIFITLLLLVDRYIHWTRGASHVIFACCKKTPPDPLAGVPEQPDVENDTGFKREHDRAFEQQWHVVALQRDETVSAAEDRIRLREEAALRRELEAAKKEKVKIVRGVATVRGIQTE